MFKKILAITLFSTTLGGFVLADELIPTTGFTFEAGDFMPVSTNNAISTVKTITGAGVTNGNQAVLFTIDEGLLPKGKYNTSASTKLAFKAPASGWQIKDGFSADLYNPGPTGIQVRLIMTDSSGTSAMFFTSVPTKKKYTLNLTADSFKQQAETWVAETPIGLSKKALDINNIKSIEFGIYEISAYPGDGFILDNVQGVTGEGTSNYNLVIKPKKEIIYGERIDNNPANEPLIENPKFLPLTDPDNTRQWKMSEMFSDEFDGNELDTTKWSGYHRFWTGRQPSIFDPKNVSIGEGTLVLTSTWEDAPTELMIEANKKLKPQEQKYQDISASAVQSIEPTGYGYYELRAKTAPISIASAFWFRDPYKSKQEIDIFEQVGRPRNDNKLKQDGSSYPMNTHWFQEAGVDISSSAIYNTGIDLTADYHIYGFEWDTYYLRFYIDGVLVHERDNSIENKIDGAQYLLFDMETNIYGCIPPLKEDFEFAPGERNPADYEIDYIRVWRSDVPQSPEKSDNAYDLELNLKAAKEAGL